MGAVIAVPKTRRNVAYGDIVSPEEFDVVIPIEYKRPFCARRAARKMLSKGLLRKPVLIIQNYFGEYIVREVIL